jgi:hypothetical protein
MLFQHFDLQSLLIDRNRENLYSMSEEEISYTLRTRILQHDEIPLLHEDFKYVVKGALRFENRKHLIRAAGYPFLPAQVMSERGS